MLQSPFDFSGLAILDDFETQAWRELFQEMEKEQSEFLALEPSFRSKDYVWPKDALHWWSRAWEYPFVAHQLQSWRRTMGPGTPDSLKVIDFGSGVTFLPFFLAKRGFNVIGVDVDEVCQHDLKKAAMVVGHEPGSVESVLCTSAGIPLNDASVDALYSVSVIEHITDLDATVSEIARVLVPDGRCILTVDLSMNDAFDLTAPRFKILRTALSRHFREIAPERSTHPARILRNSNGPFPMPPRRGWRAVASAAKGYGRKLLGGAGPRRYDLACFSFVLAKRG